MKTARQFVGWLVAPAYFGWRARVFLTVIAVWIGFHVVFRVPWAMVNPRSGESVTIEDWAWDAAARNPRFPSWFGYTYRVDYMAWILKVPFSLVTFGIIWLIARGYVRNIRRRSGECWRCGYDLRATTDPRCSECGTDCEVPKKAPGKPGAR